LTSIIPPFLKKGDEIRIISTARKISRKELEPAVNFLKSEGYKVSFGNNIFKEDHQFSGCDAERASDLQEALDDSGIRVIWLARGGYGTHRIIEKLNLDKFIENPKWIVGYSDVTVLHAFIYSRADAATLHATMPINFLNQKRESFTQMLALLSGKSIVYEIENHPYNRGGETKGVLIGGNLSIIYSLTGTNYFDVPENSILFIEDLDEYLYHVDRMMMNLRLAGVLDRISGLIVGGMSDMNDNTIPFGKNAEEIINAHSKDYNFPVAFGFPAGHINENLPLRLGAEIRLLVNEKYSRIEFID